MMTAAMHSLKQNPEALARVESIVPGRRSEEAATPEERGSAPSTLLDLLALVGTAGVSVPLAELSHALIERAKARDRVVSDREARGAVLVALALEWVRPG
jgi:hypothetical protein